MDRNDIVRIGKQIGFTYKPKEFKTDNSYHCFPCKLVLKDEAIVDYVTIYFNDYYEDVSGINIEDIIRIEESDYAIANEFRQASLNAQDYRGDRPFFLRTKNNRILGYNANNIVDFTFSHEDKGKDIKDCVDFDTARKLGFEFIKNHRELAKSIMIEYTDEILNGINKK